MTALLLPFTHPNAFETIMYSLERDDGFVCSLACNRSSFWDHCDNAVIGRRAWSWNNWSVNGLQQSTVASSVRFFMYDQLYRRSTRSTEVPLSPLHSPITCSYNIPILFESSGTNSRLESSIYSTLVVQTIVLTREREREPLNECHSNRQEILTCASWKYSVFGSSWNKKQAWTDQRSLMFYATTTIKCLPRIFVRPSVTSQRQITLACLFWHVVTSLTSTMFWHLVTSLKPTTLIVAWRRARRCSIWTWIVLDLPGWNNWLMNEAATAFEKLDYLSSFIHATLWIPRILFTVWTDKSIEAKLGNGTIDVFLMHDLRVMYRKAVPVHCTYLRSLVYCVFLQVFTH